MSDIWVKPGLDREKTIALHEALFAAINEPTPVTMDNCSNCGGVGRIIYLDPESGQMKDISCQACGGSGQK